MWKLTLLFLLFSNLAIHSQEYNKDSIRGNIYILNPDSLKLEKYSQCVDLKSLELIDYLNVDTLLMADSLIYVDLVTNNYIGDSTLIKNFWKFARQAIHFRKGEDEFYGILYTRFGSSYFPSWELQSFNSIMNYCFICVKPFKGRFYYGIYNSTQNKVSYFIRF